MRISIGGQTQDAMKVLGIEAYPFTSEELSGKFRPLIRHHHPDRNKDDPTAKDIARKLIEAYQHLRNLVITTSVDEEQEQKARRIFEEDEDMFSIWDTCPRCNGLGKVKDSFSIRDTEPCLDCDPTERDLFSRLFRHLPRRSSGIKTLKCKYCDNGRFKQRHGRVVDCRACNGTGIWKKVRCGTCSGSGVTFKRSEGLTSTCSKCDGLGKIKVNPFNPVIRKGAILATFI